VLNVVMGDAIEIGAAMMDSNEVCISTFLCQHVIIKSGV
jgi:hypothetical protein